MYVLYVSFNILQHWHYYINNIFSSASTIFIPLKKNIHPSDLKVDAPQAVHVARLRRENQPAAPPNGPKNWTMLLVFKEEIFGFNPIELRFCCS